LLKCLQGERAHPLAACEVATLLLLSTGNALLETLNLNARSLSRQEPLLAAARTLSVSTDDGSRAGAAGLLRALASRVPPAKFASALLPALAPLAADAALAVRIQV
jgi:hypothetical protein